MRTKVVKHKMVKKRDKRDTRARKVRKMRKRSLERKVRGSM